MKLGFEQLTRPYTDPDYLWKQSVITLALDIEAAKRDWRSVRPSLLHFFDVRRSSASTTAAFSP